MKTVGARRMKTASLDRPVDCSMEFAWKTPVILTPATVMGHVRFWVTRQFAPVMTAMPVTPATRVMKVIPATLIVWLTCVIRLTAMATELVMREPATAIAMLDSIHQQIAAAAFLALPAIRIAKSTHAMK